jgi:hypothetical protein
MTTIDYPVTPHLKMADMIVFSQFLIPPKIPNAKSPDDRDGHQGFFKD